MGKPVNICICTKTNLLEAMRPCMQAWKCLKSERKSKFSLLDLDT